MGCLHSSVNRIEIQRSFTSEEAACLNQTWSILKTHDLAKFGDEFLLRTMSRNASLRQFWTSQMFIDGNNFDFSEGESCVRTDISWHVGLRNHGVHFLLLLDKILSAIEDDNLLLTQIHALRQTRTLAMLDYDSLLMMKSCLIEVISERFQMFKYEFSSSNERAWDKFFSFIIQHLFEKQKPTEGNQMEVVISPVTHIEQPPNNILD